MPRLGNLLQPYTEQLKHLEMLLISVKLVRRFNFLCQLNADDKLSLRSIFGGLLLSVLGMRFAQLREDLLMMIINGTSLMLSLGLLGFFCSHAVPRCRNGLWLKLLLICLLIVLWLWHSFENVNVNVAQNEIRLVRTGIVSSMLVFGLVRGAVLATVKRTGSIWGCVLSLLIVTSKLLSELPKLDNFRLQQQLFIFGLSTLRFVHSLL
ncbi:hypothetical protein KR215_000834, partial [Drosophila sulfurigaster]